MAYYIKVTNQVAKKLGHTVDRNDTADGNKLLWQADLDRVPGDTIFDRTAEVGGAALTSIEAKREIDGCEFPAQVYTPEKYKDQPSVEEIPNTEEIPTTEETPTVETAEQPVGSAEGQVEQPTEEKGESAV